MFSMSCYSDVRYHFLSAATDNDLNKWHPDSQELCYYPGTDIVSNQAERVFKEIFSYIAPEKELAHALMNHALKKRVAFCIENRVDGTRGYYDYRFNVLAIRSSLSFYQKVAIVIHELRHVVQVGRGFRQSLDYSMNEMVRMTYAVEADVQAYSVYFAWRLKEKGRPELWDELLNFDRYRDIAIVFERTMMQSGDEIYSLKQAFIQWYASPWRRANYHQGCCMSYLDSLDESHLIESFEVLPETYFDQLCILPDGRNYGCHKTTAIKLSD